jgi:putative phosphoribosyl transferase
VDGGRQLAAYLSEYANRDDTLVLGLPRGGVPVAAEVATALHAPLDVLVVRKIGVPGHEELAMGAVGAGVTMLNGDLIARLGISGKRVDAAIEQATREMMMKDDTFRRGRPPPPVEGRIVIVVDDGLATGATMTAAVQVLRHRSPAKVIAAAPVGASDTVDRLREIAEVVCVVAPEMFAAVGNWYDDFTQTSDEEVLRLLADDTAR